MVVMSVTSDPHSPYFYFYLHFVKDMGVLFAIPPVSMDILRVLNVVPSQLFPNSWAYTKAFEMVCDDQVITPTVGVFFSLYTTKPTKSR